VVEKGDLVARVRAAVAAGPEGGEAHPVPLGYAFDPAAGYYFSAESGMYYDSSSGGFCAAASGKWYMYDSSTQQFVEWLAS
jgi:CD2 antigen cytoplasmic tail-binding protein 2